MFLNCEILEKMHSVGNCRLNGWQEMKCDHEASEVHVS
jgi:hypothetical protein